jgi:hypothetical protein
MSVKRTAIFVGLMVVSWTIIVVGSDALAAAGFDATPILLCGLLLGAILMIPPKTRFYASAFVFAAAVTVILLLLVASQTE